MPNTYTQLTIHIVFAVKNRENLIRKAYRDELFRYITGIVSNKNHKMFAVNGVSDHIHLLIGLNPATALSDLVRDIKNNTSKFINQKGWMKMKFQWQEGYGAFSYARSQRSAIIDYIVSQEEHHKKKSFRAEYLEVLQKFDVEFDERYVFEFLDDIIED